MRPASRSLVATLAAALALLGACDREAAKRPPAAEPAPAAAAPTPTGEPTTPQPSLIVLGDSLTAGFGLSAEQSYPALLQAEIDRKKLGLHVVNAGRSGDTTAGGAARVSYYLRPEVAPRGLVVWLGANDIMRGLPLEEIEKNLAAIIDQAAVFDPKMPVYLVQMKSFPNLGRDYGESFEDIYPRLAKKTGAILIPFPLEGVAGVPALNQPDGIHPTAEGTQKVGAAMWKALEPHLAAHAPD